MGGGERREKKPDSTQYGMVHLHKETKNKAVIIIDAITPTFPHGPDFQH
jgi:hypothetical protein